jgi:hypothetical protein
MEPIQFTFFSPIVASFLAVLAFVCVRLINSGAPPAAFSRFVRIVFGWALGLGAAAFAVSLLLAFMAGASTGPLGAIFVFGPVGFTLGTIIGVSLWLFRRHRA